jgi:hypothetical protein
MVSTQHARRVLDFQQGRAVPLAAILERYGILQMLRASGRNHVGRCPVHGGSRKTQFVCDLQKNVWKCFSPNCAAKGGSTIELVSALEKIDARAAAELIAEWFAIGPRSVVQQHEQRRRAMSGERPSHKVFVVEGEGDNAFWHRAGSAWPHKDGKGLNMQIPTGMSLSGRVVLREYTEEDAEQEAKSRRKK